MWKVLKKFQSLIHQGFLCIILIMTCSICGKTGFNPLFIRGFFVSGEKNEYNERN